MTHSPLTNMIKLSPNNSGRRTHAIDRITPHCVVGQLDVESILNVFLSPARQASCNYAIGYDGRIGCCVDEDMRSWCSSNEANDQRSITIECASEPTDPYAFTNECFESLAKLCADICKRYGKNKLLWIPDKNTALAYETKAGEMLLTVHRWFANKSCPGDWLIERMNLLCERVNGYLNAPQKAPTNTLYRVQVGAFSKRDNAERQANDLKAKGYDTMVVQYGDLFKVQIGAFREKANAELMKAKLNGVGVDAFITTSGGVPASVQVPKKSSVEIAHEIITGTCSDPRWSSWGNEPLRSERLRQAGYEPSAIQAEVNKALR